MALSGQRILVTGAEGFIGKNLCVRLGEYPGVEVLKLKRGDDIATLKSLTAKADVVYHLAGENRPEDPNAYMETNHGLTAALCGAVRDELVFSGRRIPIVFASSSQSILDNPYGRSKRAGEEALESLANEVDIPVTVFRLPGVFGKWSKPNYNSVVATFCYNIARGQPIHIAAPERCISLVYIDDVVEAFVQAVENSFQGYSISSVASEHTITLGNLADLIKGFAEDRSALRIANVGGGLERALYATYISYLPLDSFSYDIPQHADGRGTFVEVLKTATCGQFSFLTAGSGVTRGGHYHHSKVEKFVVIQGDAHFKFRHIVTDERFEVRASGEKPQVVETIPGWAHDITNVGKEDLIVMVWANEVFDHERPDTIASKV